MATRFVEWFGGFTAGPRISFARLGLLLTTGPGVLLIALLAVYAAAVPFVPARILIEIGDAFSVPMSLGAAVLYTRNLLRRTDRPPDAIDCLVAGIAGAWLTNGLDRLARLVSRLLDHDLLDNPIVGVFLLSLTFFAALHVFVKGNDTTPVRTYATEGGRLVMWSLAYGVIISAFVLYWNFIHPELLAQLFTEVPTNAR